MANVRLQTFRLQLALEAGHLGASGPCILDQRLHTKPHHQPILFVDDSLAPNLQLPAKSNSHFASPGQIPASHVATAGLSHSFSHELRQQASGLALHGSPGGEGCPKKPPSSCDEAESISSSPRAHPLRFVQQLMSHGKGRSHPPKHQASAAEADLASVSSREAEESELLRQASNDSNASSSSHMRVAGPSHGSGSRFEAMKSLSRSAMSPRHAVSLDSPAKLAAMRRWGTIAHKHQPQGSNQVLDPHAQSPASYSFDLGISSLTPASSFGDSPSSSFARDRHSAGLAHLVSAPVVGSRQGSFQAAFDAATAFGDLALSADSITSPTDPLLTAAAVDSNFAEDASTDATAIDVPKPVTEALAGPHTDSDTPGTAAALQPAGRAQHADRHAQGAVSSVSQPGADAESVMVKLPSALHEVSRQLEQLPLSQDSLDFSLDPANVIALAESDSQQLLQPVEATSSAVPEDEQTLLQLMGENSSATFQDEQAVQQRLSGMPTDSADEQSYESAHISASPTQPLPECGLSQDQPSQRPHHSRSPAVSDMFQVSTLTADNLDQQHHADIGAASAGPHSAAAGSQELACLLDSEPLRAAELMAMGTADGAGPLLQPSGPMPLLLPIGDGSKAAGDRQQVCSTCMPSDNIAQRLI